MFPKMTVYFGRKMAKFPMIRLLSGLLKHHMIKFRERKPLHMVEEGSSFSLIISLYTPCMFTNNLDTSLFGWQKRTIWWA